jgi:hypothetical protein
MAVIIHANQSIGVRHSGGSADTQASSRAAAKRFWTRRFISACSPDGHTAARGCDHHPGGIADRGAQNVAPGDRQPHQRRRTVSRIALNVLTSRSDSDSLLGSLVDQSHQGPSVPSAAHTWGNGRPVAREISMASMCVVVTR